MVTLIIMLPEKKDILPGIPDYALDIHTKRGKELGRGIHHSINVGTHLNLDFERRNLTYKTSHREPH